VEKRPKAKSLPSANEAWERFHEEGIYLANTYEKLKGDCPLAGEGESTERARGLT
jgi:hypothetical protein